MVCIKTGTIRIIAASLLLAAAGTLSARANDVSIQTQHILDTGTRDVVGIPQNNGAFWDGSRYWLFYGDNNELCAKTGSSLDSLVDAPTGADGTSNIGGLINHRGHGTVFGTVGGEWHAWVLANRTPDGEPYSVYRWKLGENGLENPTSRIVSLSAKDEPTQATLMPGIGGFEVESLYGAIGVGLDDGTGAIYSRHLAPDLSADTGLGKVSPRGVHFSEATPALEVHDGDGGKNWILNQINIGDPESRNSVRNSSFSEWRRTQIAGGGEQWSAESELEAAGAGNWADMNYAVDRGTSHAGQTDFVQLADGTIFNAYVDGHDDVNGLFGNLVLKTRGPNTDDGWSTVSTSAIPDGSTAWHVAMTSDGEKPWLVYVKSADDTPGTTERQDVIHLLSYDPESDSFGDEIVIAEIADGFRFDRMITQWRFFDKQLVVLWSETDAGIFRDEHEGATWRMNVSAVTIPDPGTLGLLALGGAATLLRRRQRC